MLPSLTPAMAAHLVDIESPIIFKGQNVKLSLSLWLDIDISTPLSLSFFLLSLSLSLFRSPSLPLFLLLPSHFPPPSLTCSGSITTLFLKVLNCLSVLCSLIAASFKSLGLNPLAPPLPLSTHFPEFINLR